MAIPAKSTLFLPELAVTEMVNLVKGKSSLAIMSAREPIPFNGQKEFTFTMDSEIDVVAEGGAKSHGGVTIAPKTIVPIKIEYGARVSDEFMYAAEDAQVGILKAFNDGFAKKVSKGLDLMAMHGINPRTGAASTVIGTNHFDAAATQTVEYVPASADENVESAIALVNGSEGEVSGIIMSRILSSGLAALTFTSGEKKFPQLAWGASPEFINGVRVDINTTVNGADTIAKDRAIVGDFENYFQWGYAKEVPMEVIEYGDPDNSGNDLKGHNQVYLRAEMYLGWGILDGNSFARIIDAV